MEIKKLTKNEIMYLICERTGWEIYSTQYRSLERTNKSILFEWLKDITK